MLTPSRVLDGRSLAGAGLRNLAARVEALRLQGAAAPTLLALASADDPSAPRTLELKARAAARAGIGFRARLIGGEGSLERLLREAAVDPSIHGIFVQWPVASAPGPPAPLLDVIPMEKDVDASSPGSRQALGEGHPVHCPAEALAVVEALGALGVTPAGAPITVVGGDDATTLGILATLRLHGGAPERVTADDPRLREALARAEVVVTAQAPANGIPGEWLRPGAVVVDGGYTLPGGSGHLALGPGTPPLRARVPPRGGIGPLTVLALLRNTVRAAELLRSAHRATEEGPPHP